MNPTKRDIWAFAIFSVLLFCVIWFGFDDQDWQKLSQHPSSESKDERIQNALDHLFGADISFNNNESNRRAGNNDDTLRWQDLATTTITRDHISYSKKALLQKDRNVKITGYIFPLEGTDTQHHFILSAYAPSCPYCLPGSGNDLIEVYSSKKIPFTYQPIKIEGPLHLLTMSEYQDTGFLYQIKQ